MVLAVGVTLVFSLGGGDDSGGGDGSGDGRNGAGGQEVTHDLSSPTGAAAVFLDAATKGDMKGALAASCQKITRDPDLDFEDPSTRTRFDQTYGALTDYELGATRSRASDTLMTVEVTSRAGHDGSEDSSGGDTGTETADMTMVVAHENSESRFCGFESSASPSGRGAPPGGGGPGPLPSGGPPIGGDG